MSHPLDRLQGKPFSYISAGSVAACLLLFKIRGDVEIASKSMLFLKAVETSGGPLEGQVSVRLLWPFARLVPAEPLLVDSLRRAGIHAEEFANPTARLPHRVMIGLLQDAVETTGNPALGLCAGRLTEPGDFEVLEYAARSCATLGDALDSLARHLRLIHDAIDLRVNRDGDRVFVTLRTTDGVPQPSAANDFAVAAVAAFIARNISSENALLELRFVHPRPLYAAEYTRLLHVPVTFGASHNAVVLSRESLTAPMIHGEPNAAKAFARRADTLVVELRETDGIAGRVRDVVARRGVGDVTMEWTAARLGMSVATLRRRLDGEGTTFSEIIDTVRRSFAERILQEGSLSISEVAYSLGFSSVGAFHRAFKRWTGVAPAAYRSRKRSQFILTTAPAELVAS